MQHSGGTLSSAMRRPLSPAIPWRTNLRRFATMISWRYRHLGVFLIVGLASLVLEAVLIESLLPQNWPWMMRASLAFVVGMLIAAVVNVQFNFQVTPSRQLRAILVYGIVSLVSLSLNLGLAYALRLFEVMPYSIGRLVASGALCGVIYIVHRRWTFHRLSRNLGLAIYLNSDRPGPHELEHLRDACDHVHFDLIDRTLDPNAAPIESSRIVAAREHWTWQPLVLHIMSRTPLRWTEELGPQVDTVLFHPDGEDDPLDVIARARELSLRVGVVCHGTMTLADLLRFLPMVDYVMVLGIERPGQSGQPIREEAIAIATELVNLENRYHFQTMFDGGVSLATLPRIPSRILVSSSAVTSAQHPLRAALMLMEGIAET